MNQQRTPSPRSLSINIEHHDVIDSTQLAARRLIEARQDAGSILPPTLVTAAEQTAGVGRSAKPWRSPRGGLWATLLYPLPSSTAHIPGTLGLALGVACAHVVRRTLAVASANQETIADTRLRWPNDVYVRGEKILGVLTEIIQPKQHRFALVGVGLNLNITPVILEEIGRTAAVKPTSILSRTGVVSDIDVVTADLAHALVTTLSKALRAGEWSDAGVIAEAEQILFGVGEHQRLTLGPNRTAEGVLLGLDSTGSPWFDNTHTGTPDTRTPLPTPHNPTA